MKNERLNRCQIISDFFDTNVIDNEMKHAGRSF